MNNDYIASEYRRMHEAKMFGGGSLEAHLPEIRELIKKYNCQNILDYGCGKAKCHKEKLADRVYLYDPYCYPYDIKPSDNDLFDMVICTDVLEHIPEGEVGKVIHELMYFTNKVLFLAISTQPAKKKLTNGENVHVTIKPKEWWEEMLITHKDIRIVRHYS